MKEKLLAEALRIVGEQKLNGFKKNRAGSVAAALMTKAGNIYSGISLEFACGLGFCAEAAAIAEMLKHKESEIKMIVAVTDKGMILPPCGRCRELIYQTNKKNIKTKIITGENEVKVLSELLPDIWIERS